MVVGMVIFGFLVCINWSNVICVVVFWYVILLGVKLM